MERTESPHLSPKKWLGYRVNQTLSTSHISHSLYLPHLKEKKTTPSFFFNLFSPIECEAFALLATMSSGERGTSQTDAAAASQYWRLEDTSGTRLGVTVREGEHIRPSGATVPTVKLKSEGLACEVEIVRPPPNDIPLEYPERFQDIKYEFVGRTPTYFEGTHTTFMWLLLYERDAMRDFMNAKNEKNVTVALNVAPWRMALLSESGMSHETKEQFARVLALGDRVEK